MADERTPGRQYLAGSASAGGVRFLDGGNLRCFSKVRCLSEASSDFWKTVLADFRHLRSQPPTKPQTGQYPEPRRPFSHQTVQSPTTSRRSPPSQPSSAALMAQQPSNSVKTTRLAGGLLCPYKGLFPACARKAH